MTDGRHEQMEQLGALRDTHLEEERTQARDTLIHRPRPLKVVRPIDGDLPLSTRYLERLYAGGRMAKEKKPGLFDHLRSIGPWMTSIDTVPLSVLDGMSQTATLTHGFAPDAVVRAYMNGEFGDTSLTSYDSSISTFDAVNQYAANLANRVPMLDHVSFTNSGAEANEKAFSLCRAASAYPNAKRVLGFKGSFHGRTLLALQTTWNPLKRAPFELPSYLSVFVDFPLRDATVPEETEWVDGLSLALTESTDPRHALQQLKGSASPLFDQELESLCQVTQAALSGEIFTVIIEPMQSEGGDRYATARFYKALRLLTRTLGLPLIFDEVQTGFGLGGPFDWSSKFNLVDAKGQPDSPDAITYAKRAQVGVCISRFEDPEPSSAHIASMIRANLTTNTMDFGATAERMAQRVEPRLKALAERYPQLVSAPRNTGFAFAFDLPTPAHLMAYLGQRFWRGAVVFGAGTKTVRYRLSNAFEPSHLKILFETIEQSLQHVAEHGDAPAPKWINPDLPPKQQTPNTRVRPVSSHEQASIMPRLLDIESQTYEPARQDTPETLSMGFSEGGVVIIAEVETDSGWLIVGSALAGPLEGFPALDGPKQDPNRGLNTTAYSIALTIHPDFHGLGLGRALKGAQLEAARALTNADGSPRYQSMVGRNRVGMTDSMGHLNDSFGAYTLKILPHQYGGDDGFARYYSIPLRGFVPTDSGTSDPRMHWSSGHAQPFTNPPASLQQRASEGTLFGPTVNKVTICNYVTPSVVRAVEWAGALAPELPHLYLSSGRDELIDKSVRLLRYARKNAEVCLSFEGGYVGHTSATARSISCSSVHQQGAHVFEWPSTMHPETDLAASIAALNKAVKDAGGAESILGLFVEPVGERSGKVIDGAAASALNAWSKQHDIPIVAVDTAGGYGRCYEQHFAYQDIGLDVALLAWWPGGQTGFLHTNETYFIAKPLMMVSTWDGDELSMIRFHHNSMETLSADRTAQRAQHALVYDKLTALNLQLKGVGSHRLLVGGTAAQSFVEKCKEDGLELKAFANDLISLALPFDLSREHMEKGVEIITRHAHLITDRQ